MPNRSGKEATTAIVWLRRDLRLRDNPALAEAAASGAIVPVFILEEGGGRAFGGAARWWLHHSLAALDRSLGELGSRLVLRRGRPADVLLQLAAQTNAGAVHFNRRYGSPEGEIDGEVRAALEARGVEVHEHPANLLFEPEEVQTGSGGFYRVFTPFWRAVTAMPPPRGPRPAPETLSPPPAWPEGERLAEWRLLPAKPDWAAGFHDHWRPGEAGAQERLSTFVAASLRRYAGERDRPDLPSTSMLSPHLAFGEISPFDIWQRIGSGGPSPASREKFRQELVWREFCHHLLHHAPDLRRSNFNPAFDAFPWAVDDALLLAWQRGETGYPIVDAGMRQLWQTGWMHNRVRMIVASFLVKDLLVDWRRGEEWFWDTLVDADPANNPASWQWVAGPGADAAPYFRIFNPVLQGEKFDPDGAYVRRYMPELAALPDRFVHQPWRATGRELAAAGIRLGETYPHPIVDHKAARERALRAFARMREGA